MAELKPRTLPTPSPKQIERVWSYVDRSGGPDACWLWKGSVNGGYGRLSMGWKRMVYAHRFAYFIETGIDPGALEVLHRCDQMLCCNPAHLFLGTQKDNMHDASIKGRMKWGPNHLRRTDPSIIRRGEDAWCAKLTESDVIEMRTLWNTGCYTQIELGKMFGLASTNVSKIVRRLLWKHVP